MTVPNIYSAITNAGWTLGLSERHERDKPVVYNAHLQRDNVVFFGTGTSQGGALLDAMIQVSATAQTMTGLIDAVEIIVDLIEAANEGEMAVNTKHTLADGADAITAGAIDWDLCK